MADVEIRPLRGLWRTPNTLASPPGSCSTLDNCCIRKAGVIEPIDALKSQGASLNTPHRMFDAPGDDVLVIDSSGGTYALQWVDKTDGTQTDVQVNGASPTFEDGAATVVRYRDRYYITAKEGLLCMDSAGDATARRAGLVAPPFWLASASTSTNTDAQSIPDGMERSYRAVFEREMPDGSIVVGPPSSAYAKGSQGGSTTDWTLRIAWENPTAEVVAGDFVALYATDEVTKATPFSGGDTQRLVKRVELSSTDITNEYVDIRDDVPKANLGVELYTNPGQKGLAKAHYPPPYLRDCVYFQGAFVGVAYNEAYSITLTVPGSFEDTDDTVAERLTGVGRRAITGDTNTSVTITNVNDADHFKGLSVGQVVSHADFPAGTQITTWDSGANTITVDTAATASNAAQSIVIYDVIEVAGTEYTVEADKGALYEDPSGNDAGVVAISSQPDDGKMTGAQIVFRAERAAHTGTTFSVRGTNPAHYSPNIPALADTAKAADDSTKGNRIAWSEPDQPEHWPLVNRDTVGEGDIIRLIVAGDICYIFTTKAEVYAMTGLPDAWRYDLVAENVQLLSAGGVKAYQGSVYAWCDKGLVQFSGGVMARVITDQRLTDDMKEAHHNLVISESLESPPWTWFGHIEIDRFHKELWLMTGYEGSADGDCQPWIYNLDTDEFYRMSDTNLIAPLYVESAATMYVGVRAEADAYELKEYEFREDTNKKASTNIVFNRTDLGMGGGLKKWREVVLHLIGKANGDETFSFTTTADDTVGEGTNSTNYVVTLDTGAPTVVTCHVARNSGMSVQQQIQLQRTTDTTWWELEALTVRADLLADRTGARAA